MNARSARLHSPSLVLIAWALLVLLGADGSTTTALGLGALAIAHGVAELERALARRDLARRIPPHDVRPPA